MVLVPLTLWFAPLGIDPKMQKALAITAFMIGSWITHWQDVAISGLMGLYLFWATGVVGSGDAFHGFATTTPWFLFGAILTAAELVVASAWSIGLGYSLRPWKGELGAVRHALIALGSQDKVFVQGELYPHAGYDRHVQLLTAHDVQAQASQSAVILLASRGSVYPLRKDQWRCLTSLPRLSAMPGGLLAIPFTATARQCVSSRRL